MPLLLKLLVGGVALLVAAYAGHRVLLAMGRRGWISYGKRRFRAAPRGGGGGGMAGVLASFQQFVEPEIRYVIEEQDQRKASSADEASPADR